MDTREDSAPLVGSREATPALYLRRGELGLRQADVAERAGVTRGLYSAIEERRRLARPSSCAAIAAALGSDVDELFATPLIREGVVPAARWAKRHGLKPDTAYGLIARGEITGLGLCLVRGRGARSKARWFVDPEPADAELAARPACKAEGCSNTPYGKSGYCRSHFRRAGQEANRVENRHDLGNVRELFLDKHMSGPEIARAYGVTSPTVYYWLNKLEINRDGMLGKRRAIRIADAREEHPGARTRAEFAEAVGLTPAAVAQWERDGLARRIATPDVPGPDVVLVVLIDVDLNRFLREWALGLRRVPGVLVPFPADGRRESWRDPEKALDRIEKMLETSSGRILTRAERAEHLKRKAARARLLSERSKGPRTPPHHYEWARKFVEIRDDIERHEGKAPTDWRVAKEIAREDDIRWPLGNRARGWDRGAADTILKAIKRLQIAQTQSAA